MKRLFAVILSLLLVLTFAACSKEEEKKEIKGEVKEEVSVNTEIQNYFDQEYEVGMNTYSEDTWSGIIQKDDSYIKISSPITKEQYEAFNALDFSDEQAEKDLIASLIEATVEDITSQIPSQEKLDTYIGKSLGEMEEEGWENIGTMSDENSYIVTLDGPTYQIEVTFSDEIDLSNLDNYSPNEINKFKIASVSFVGFSWGFLD